MNTDLALFFCVWVGTCHMWISEKEEELYQIAAKNKIDPASLAVTDQPMSTQGKRKLILDPVPFHDMIFQPISFLQIFVTCGTHTDLLFNGGSCT